MDKLPDDIVLYISKFLKEEDHEQLSKTCLTFFWTFWDISTCYWCDIEPNIFDYDMYHKDDFVAFCWFPHPNKCIGGCLGLPWYNMCKKCREFEDNYYDNLEYYELSLEWNYDWY